MALASSEEVEIQADIFADTYMIFMSLLGSVILFGIGGLDYVDALFFSMGAATQSGLNTFVLHAV